MRKNRKITLLILPLLIAYLFQATQYARAPVKYGYYIVYAKNADIALLAGEDLSPEDGEPLLRNSTSQTGLYNLSLGRWAPGYRINYTSAFKIRNNEAFAVILTCLNFSSSSTGTEYLAIYIKNGTEWVAAWLGSETWSPASGNQLNSSNYIYLAANGGEAVVKIAIRIPEANVGLNQTSYSLKYGGTMYLWFTSTY